MKRTKLSAAWISLFKSSTSEQKTREEIHHRVIRKQLEKQILFDEVLNIRSRVPPDFSGPSSVTAVCLFGIGMIFLTFAIFCTSLLHLVSSARTPKFRNRKALSVEYFENCENQVYPIMYLGWSFLRNGSTSFINGEEVVSKDTSEPITALFRIHKCRDKNVETCEYYNTWKWESLCTVIRLVPFLKGYLELHTPPLTCPFKKGHYYLRNARFDAFTLTELLASGSAKQLMWKFRAMIVERNQTTACVDFALRVANIRVKL
ncbi:uncharacterized protein [Bemisia tabaci]|uniref:uncharacterized protein isoform X1 n=1 Tax=Bemisia tabaci TaxID=7038 RepID=UPI003B288983